MKHGLTFKVMKALSYGWPEDGRDNPLRNHLLTWMTFDEVYGKMHSYARFVIGHSDYEVMGNRWDTLCFDLTKTLEITAGQTTKRYRVPAVVELYDDLEHAMFVLKMRSANNEF